LRFTARSYLTYLAQLSGLWDAANRQRVQSVLEQVDLNAAAGERLASYSKGMLQRLSIAQTLLTDPQLLILDEPTNGLDPYSQWQVRQIIAALRKQGKTILLCSNYLTEVEMLCDAVGILQHGKLVQSGTVSEPSMGQWLGKPYPSTVNNFDEDEDAAWGNGHDLEPMLADFREIRAEQIALLPNFDAQTWNETRNTVWGKQTLKWVVTKTFQHTAEHTHDVLRMDLFWDMFVQHLQEKGG